MPIYTRNPTLMAMTAAGVDFLSGGRFNLGLGIGGLELLEGFFGTTFDGSLGRMREYVGICRKVWAKEGPLVHEGRHYQVPSGGGQRWGRPRMMLEQPVRSRIPVWLAAIGEKSVAQTAEIADGWLPLFLIPEKIEDAWGSGAGSRAGQAGPRARPAADLRRAGHVAIGEGEDVLKLRDLVRPDRRVLPRRDRPAGPQPLQPARPALRVRAGGEARRGSLAGGQDRRGGCRGARRDARAPPRSSGREAGWRERIAAYREAGVTQLQVSPITPARFKAGAEHGFNWHADPSTADLIAEVKQLAG